MHSAINDLMLDLLAAVARKDYQDRRRRQKEGIKNAKSQGRYNGQQCNKVLLDKVSKRLKEKNSDIVGEPNV